MNVTKITFYIHDVGEINVVNNMAYDIFKNLEINVKVKGHFKLQQQKFLIYIFFNENKLT